MRLRTRALGLPDLDAYASYLDSHPREADELVRSLSVKVTRFFRNPSFYRFLERRILPGIDGPIWSAGCATGEEAYSIAMLLAARDAPAGPAVLATDLDRSAVTAAREASYPADVARHVPAPLARRFLLPDGRGRVRVAPEAASRVTFRTAGILSMPRRPFFDLIVCRNVLIYFGLLRQREALARLAGTLRPGGYLALGRAERLTGAAREMLSTVSLAERIYRRV